MISDTGGPCSPSAAPERSRAQSSHQIKGLHSQRLEEIIAGLNDLFSQVALLSWPTVQVWHPRTSLQCTNKESAGNHNLFSVSAKTLSWVILIGGFFRLVSFFFSLTTSCLGDGTI